jgi:DNA-binding LytR/AlgR family response regulator
MRSVSNRLLFPLPIADEPVPSASRPLQECRSPRPAPPLRALVVDDDVCARRRLAKMLLATREFATVSVCAHAEALPWIKAEAPDVLFLVHERPRRAPAMERIPCTGPSCIRLVDVDEVEHVRCSAAGVYVVTPKGEFLTDLTMQELEEQTRLARCHRQYLVDVRRIEAIHRPEPRAAVLRMKSGHEVPVSRRYFGALKHRLGLRRDSKYVDPLS